VETGRPRLTFLREKFAELVAAGWTVEAAAKAVRIHRATAYRWCDQMGLPKRAYRRTAKN
jgi:transposase